MGFREQYFSELSNLWTATSLHHFRLLCARKCAGDVIWILLEKPGAKGEMKKSSIRFWVTISKGAILLKGNWINKIFRLLDIFIKDLKFSESKILNCLQIYIHFWKSGASFNPGFGHLAKIARALGVELSELFQFHHLEPSREKLLKDINQLLSRMSDSQLQLAYRLLKAICQWGI